MYACWWSPKYICLLIHAAPPKPPSWLPNYEEAVAKQGCVSVTINGNIFMGPSAVGKSCLKHLLVHDRPKEVKISTPVMAKPDVVSIAAEKYAIEGTSVWKLLSDEEMARSIRSSVLNRQYDATKTMPEVRPALPDVRPEDSHTKFAQPVIEVDRPTVANKSPVHSSHHSQPSAHPTKQPSAHPAKQSVFHEAHLSLMCDHGGGLEAELQLNGARLVHLLDTGGQPSFQDVLPLLLDIPCTYVNVFNAANDLDQPAPVTYRPDATTEVKTSSGPETAWEMMLRSLSSVQTLVYKVPSNAGALPMDMHLPTFRTVLVGTFKDHLMEKGNIAEVSENISKRIELLEQKPYYFHIVPDADGRLFFLVNNMPHHNPSKRIQADQATINNLRKVLSHPDGALKASIPIGWFYFEIVCRRVNQKFFPFSELLKHAREVKGVRSADPSHEFRSLLQLFHFLGVFTFLDYTDVSDTVCTDNSAFLKEVSKLLAVDFISAPKCHSLKFFKKTGVLSLDKALYDELGISNEVNAAWMLRCLCHLGITARLSQPGDVNPKYFMPAALPSGDSSIGAGHSSCSRGSIAPLLVAFKSTEHAMFSTEDMPQGIFPRLAVELANKGWEPVRNGNTRLAIKFQWEELDIFVRKCAGYICIIPNLSVTVNCTVAKLHERCYAILSTFEKALQASAQALFGATFTDKAKAQFGFLCTCGNPTTHPAIQRGDSIVCNLSGDRQVYLKSQKVWFCQVEGAQVSVLKCCTCTPTTETTNRTYEEPSFKVYIYTVHICTQPPVMHWLRIRMQSYFTFDRLLKLFLHYSFIL